MGRRQFGNNMPRSPGYPPPLAMTTMRRQIHSLVLVSESERLEKSSGGRTKRRAHYALYASAHILPIDKRSAAVVRHRTCRDHPVHIPCRPGRNMHSRRVPPGGSLCRDERWSLDIHHRAAPYQDRFMLLAKKLKRWKRRRQLVHGDLGQPAVKANVRLGFMPIALTRTSIGRLKVETKQDGGWPRG